MITSTMLNKIDDNGLVLSGHQLPQEMLTDILLKADLQTLLNCQLVCKRWRTLIQTYVWRKKAEMVLGRSLRFPREVSWNEYYFICKKKPFKRNLIKNHSGEEGINRHWKILSYVSPNSNCQWWVEKAAAGGGQLPHDGYGQFYLAADHYGAVKYQIIDLAKEGLTPYILDNLQPPIQVREWYSNVTNSPAVYDCTVELLNENGKTIKRFHFHDDIESGQKDRWQYLSYRLENYGPGVRRIYFEHGGIDRPFWAESFTIKMTGACVCVEIPAVPRPLLPDANE